MDTMSRRGLLQLLNQRVLKTFRSVISVGIGNADELPRTPDEAGRELGRTLRPLPPFSPPPSSTGDQP
jgi:hypothetical protein